LWRFGEFVSVILLKELASYLIICCKDGIPEEGKQILDTARRRRSRSGERLRHDAGFGRIFGQECGEEAESIFEELQGADNFDLDSVGFDRGSPECYDLPTLEKYFGAGEGGLDAIGY
jgi:hypothetical protein